MSKSESSELTDVISRAFVDDLGGRASMDETVRAVIADLPDHLREHLVVTGLRTAVGRYFRSRTSDGLATAPEADSKGTHVDVEQLSFKEFEHVIRRHLKSAGAYTQRAAAYADRCEAVHGKRPQDVRHESRAAS